MVTALLRAQNTTPYHAVHPRLCCCPKICCFLWLTIIDRMRGLQWWKRFAAYFPMSLRSEEKLNPDKTYVFGYHPHGIISVGALATFGTEGLNFSSTFQGIDVHLVTLPQNFRIPFLLEIWLMLGICDSSKATFRKVCYALLLSDGATYV